MQAVRYHGRQDIRLDTVPIPSTKPGWVRLKPAFCGICGSDLHEYFGGPNAIPASGKPHSITGEEVPVTLGHEFSGVVDEVGDGVTHVKKGDHVCVQPIIYDGDCRSCARGLYNCCDKFGFIGISGWGGGMSEYTCAPASAVKLLPDNISLEIGALVEPLAVGWHAVDASPFKESDTVLVLGGGPIGLAVVLALVAKSCKNIIVSEVSKRRREFARDFGAHHVVDPTESDLVTSVNELTNNQGADIGFDAAGVQVAVDAAFRAIKARGTLVNIALWESNRVYLNINEMLIGEKHYTAVATYSKGDFEAVISAISSGKMKPQGMITKVIRLDEVVEEGFMALAKDKENQVKVMIDVGGSIS